MIRCTNWLPALIIRAIAGGRSLQAAMHKAGLQEDCLAGPDTVAAAQQLPNASALPLPGEVELLMGGPPCQGFSGKPIQQQRMEPGTELHGARLQEVLQQLLCATPWTSLTF